MPRWRDTFLRDVGSCLALYLDLMEQALTRSFFRGDELKDIRSTGWKRLVVREITRRGYGVEPYRPTDWHFEGRHWPRTAKRWLAQAAPKHT